MGPPELELVLPVEWHYPGPVGTPSCASGFANPLLTSLLFQYARKEQEDEGKKRYEEQKLDRLETKQRNGDVILPVINPGNTGSVEPVQIAQQYWETKLVSRATLAIPRAL